MSFILTFPSSTKSEQEAELISYFICNVCHHFRVLLKHKPRNQLHKVFAYEGSQSEHILYIAQPELQWASTRFAPASWA